MLKCRPADDVHGYVGEITDINMEVVEEAISKNFIPVISTIGYEKTATVTTSMQTRWLPQWPGLCRQRR